MARDLAPLEIPHLQEQLATIDVSVLDPERLSPEAERAASELLQQGSSENTNRSYRSALKYWAAWFIARYRHPIALPVELNVVVQFIVDHAERLNDSGVPISQLPP